MHDLICPKCGVSNTKKQFIGAFCIDCVPIKLETPTKLDLRICKKCNRMLLRGEWMPFSNKKLNDFVLSKCKGDFNEDTGIFDRESGELILEVKGKKITRHIEVNIDSNQCPQCSRISGGYYQAIIQFRCERKKIDKFA